MKFNSFVTSDETIKGILTQLPTFTGRVSLPLLPKNRSTRLDSCPSKGMMQFRWCEDTAKVSKLAKQSLLTGRAASSILNGCHRKRLMAQPSMWGSSLQVDITGGRPQKAPWTESQSTQAGKEKGTHGRHDWEDAGMRSSDTQLSLNTTNVKTWSSVKAIVDL